MRRSELAHSVDVRAEIDSETIIDTDSLKLKPHWK